MPGVWLVRHGWWRMREDARRAALSRARPRPQWAGVGRPVAPAGTKLPVAFAVFILALAAVAACGCGGDSSSGGTPTASSPAAAPRPGGTFRYPLQFDVDSLLPGRIVNSPEVAHQIYEGLVAYERREDGRFVTVPCLAESWEANADATVWTFRLRRGVRFQEPVGSEVTAGDVVAVYRYSALRSNRSLTAYMNAILRGTRRDGTVPRGRMDDLGVEALDRYTVRFTLKQPFAAFPDTVGGVAGWVWPVDYLERVGREAFEQRPVGTGPFVVSRRVPGRYIDLVRNPGWWDASSGRPYLESVHFVVFKSVIAQLRAFQQGLLDFTPVPQGQIPASKALPQVESGEWIPVVLPNLITAYVCFDMRDSVVGGEAGLPLRRAIDAAIDRRAVVQAASDGLFVPQTGLVPPVFAGWEEQPPQDRDPSEAERLAAEAGRPRLTLAFAEDRVGAAVAEYVREVCAAAGIELVLQSITWEEWLALFGQGRGPAFYLTGWLADYPSYDNFLYDMYVSSLSPFTSGTSYSDPDVDRLLTLARATADPGTHLDLSRRAAHEILADKTVLPLFEFADYRLLSSRIGGFSVSPMYGVDAWKLWLR